MFKVSVKGIVACHGSYLLRVNERGDYELLGGKLERRDATLADRVRQELLEESGVVVEPMDVREPWFYVFGDQAVLIVPLTCSVTTIPKTLFDQDGGRLEWVESDRLDSIRLPKSYLASIRGERPRLLHYEGNPTPPYPDDQYCVELVVQREDGEKRSPLDDACDFAEAVSALGYPNARFLAVRYQGGTSLQVVFYDADHTVNHEGTRWLAEEDSSNV